MIDDRRNTVMGRQNLKQDVAQHIRDLIFSGTVHPGQRLDQDKLAEELGVSRLPVREALITLEAEGMVNNVARQVRSSPAWNPTTSSTTSGCTVC